MKKFMCTLLTLAMLCSFMVVNVSATNTYEGEGFRIVTDYELTLYDTEEALGGIFYEYGYDAGDGEDDNGITLGVLDSNNDEAAEYVDYVLKNSNGETFKGYPAVITEDYRSEYDIYNYSIVTLRDDVIFIIGMSAMGNSNYQIMLEIVNSIEFTDEYSDVDDENDYYEEDYDDYEVESSTYWENEYFYIDSDTDLCEEVQCEDEELCDYIYYPSCYADDYLNYFEIEIRFPDDIDEAVREWNSLLSEGSEKYDDYDYKEKTIHGFTCYQHTFETNNYYTRGIVFSDGNALYVIAVCSESSEILKELCDIVENDIHFKNAPVDDDKAEANADKSDKEADEKKDDEEKNNSTIIIVAIVAGAVVILGVTAMIIFGKKKKQ